ncbi:MAG: MBL fold metallo-hydrolase [Chloroflexi bacterium]|nr:MBL fold metallo-hydrolase [Chloroflexota bacterium]
MERVTANVYTDTCPPDKVVGHGSNSSFVITSEGLVLIDAPYLPTNAVKWREEVMKRGKLRFIINTEHHRDHITGNYFFPEGVVITSQVVRELFSASIVSPDAIRQRIGELNPEGVHLLKDFKIRPPTIAFMKQMKLYLGEHVFHLMHLPGHTPGQTAVHLPKEGVVFTGDNFTNGWQPSLNYSCPLEWVESLKAIEALDFERIVPGHGNIGSKKDVPVFRSFIEECVAVVKKAIDRGMSQEEAVAGITFETEAYPPRLHPGPEQQRLNVARLYEMLSKRPGK